MQDNKSLSPSLPSALILLSWTLKSERNNELESTIGVLKSAIITQARDHLTGLITFYFFIHLLTPILLSLNIRIGSRRERRRRTVVEQGLKVNLLAIRVSQMEAGNPKRPAPTQS
jgi:hypothetical protein